MSKIEQVKEILKVVWKDASKWGTTFEGTPAVDNWLQAKSKEIDDLYSQWIEALEKQNKELHNELVRLKDNPSHPSSDLMLSDEEIDQVRINTTFDSAFPIIQQIRDIKAGATFQLAKCQKSEDAIRADERKKVSALVKSVENPYKQLNQPKAFNAEINGAETMRAAILKEIEEK
jgi:hypothetical protein